MSIKKICFLLLLSFSLLLTVNAKVTVDYVFSLVIDENVRDQSGNHRVPECHFGEDDYVSGEFDSVRFSKPDHSVKVPFAAFPGKSGKAALKLNLEKTDRDQVFFRVYSPYSDGLVLQLRSGKLRGSYYNRAAKRYFHIQGPQLQSNVWYDITFTWAEGDRITLQCNEWKNGRRVDADMVMDFRPDSVMFVGNSHVGKAAMQGKLHRFTLSDSAKKAPVKKAAPKVAAGITRNFKLGEFTLGINERGEVARLAARGSEFVFPQGTALWVMKTVDKKSGSFAVVSPQGKPEITNSSSKVAIKWANVAAEITLAPEKDTLIWKLRAAAPENFAIDSIEYPRLRLQPTSNPPEAMHFVYPSYFGCSRPDPFSAADGRPRSFGNTYGGGAHYQFCFMHAPDKPGLYIETRDSDGRIKEFRFNSDRGGKSGVFHLNQMPELRMSSTTFASPYEVRTTVLEGDWYDAAKRYRGWAIQQPWCRNGKLHENSSVPQWLKECDFAVRLHTWTRPKNSRRLSTNVEKAQYLADVLGKPNSLGIWYCLTYIPGMDSIGAANGDQTNGNARSDAVFVDGVKAAMQTFAANNQHIIHYVNSRIFDQSLKSDHAETQRIRQMVMRDFDGSMQLYGKTYFEGCRVDPRWQEHLLGLIRHTVRTYGFRGTYLDSFGRGQEFCYAADHGHKVAEDCGSVKGQRIMSTRIKNEMRKYDPNYILCSEASIEQFIDQIDVKLHHYNIFEYSVPVWAAIYHDYQLVHGRSMNTEAVNSPESNAALAAGAFHNGAIIGRFFADRHSFRELYCLDALAGFYRQVSACRQEFRDYLSYGEMLRPPKVANSTAENILLGVRKRKFQHPAVVASLWKAPDGKVAAFVTNASGKTAECDIVSSDIKPVQLIRYRNDGSRSLEKFTGGKLTLAPYSVIVLQ